jgi:RecA-family ATPase
VLIIIDPLFRFVRVEDGNDYATMTAALEPLLVLARETGACVLLVHHLGKGDRNDGSCDRSCFVVPFIYMGTREQKPFP